MVNTSLANLMGYALPTTIPKARNSGWIMAGIFMLLFPGLTSLLLTAVVFGSAG